MLSPEVEVGLVDFPERRQRIVQTHLGHQLALERVQPDLSRGSPEQYAGRLSFNGNNL